MKSLHSRDKNLIFNYNRERLIEPQSKSNLYIPYVEGIKQKWKQIPIPSGKDKNTFFRVNKTPQPILSKRLVGAIDPLSGTVAKLPKTVKERQAAGIVASMEGILEGLRNFMSSPEVDAQGNVVIDPISNQPVIKVRTIIEILAIAHAALIDAFMAGGVIANNSQVTIMQSMTVNSSILVVEQLRDLEKVQPNRPQAERSQLYGDAIIKERLRLDDQIQVGDPVIPALIQAVDDQNIDDDWHNHAIYTQNHVKPADWTNHPRPDPWRLDLLQFIMARESQQGIMLATVNAVPIPIPVRSLLMGGEFSRNRYLNLTTLAFRTLAQVPGGEQ